MWGGLTLAGSSLAPQDGTGNRTGRVKLKNSSGARIAWEGKETPGFPLSCFLPQFFLLSTCGHLGSAFLAVPSRIPVHPQPQRENQKSFDCSAPAQTPPCCQHCFGHKSKPEQQTSSSEGNEVNPSQSQCPVECHSFWWWQPVPALYLWFMVVLPKGGVCISVF